MDEVKKIVVVVEDEEAARTALRWALHNLLRYGDVLILLHVFSSTSFNHKKKKPEVRRLRRHGYQLAVSFKELCSDFFNTRIEMIVAEEEDEGDKMVALVREIEPFALVAGLHDRSFLYQPFIRLAGKYNNDLVSAFNCRVLAIKQPTSTTSVKAAGGRGQQQAPQPQALSTSIIPAAVEDNLQNASPLGFSQVDVSTGFLQMPRLIQPQKIPYGICPTPYAIIWRRSKKTRRRSSPHYSSS